jgi:anti-anti-sigma factor
LRISPVRRDSVDPFGRLRGVWSPVLVSPSESHAVKFHFVGSVDGSVDVRAEGPIAPDSPEQLAAALLDLVGPKLYDGRLRLNLAEADFISSAGIGGLLHCHKRFREQGGELAILAPSRTIRQTFEMMRLQSVLKID